jgi:hypothetical protein
MWVKQCHSPQKWLGMVKKFKKKSHMVMTFLSLGWLIYINLWHSSTHIRDDPTMPKNRHGSSWWNHCHREMLWGRKNSPSPLPHQIEELARIYIYIIIVLYILLYYIYIRMYIAYMYMIYIVATLSQKRHLSVSSQKIPSGDAPVFDWGLGRSDHRDVDHLVIRISKRGKTVNRYVKSGGYVYYIYMSYMICNI